MAEKTLVEEMAEVLEHLLVIADGYTVIMRECLPSEDISLTELSIVQARAVLARYRADPETLLREAGKARRELGERVMNETP